MEFYNKILEDIEMGVNQGALSVIQSENLSDSQQNNNKNNYQKCISRNQKQQQVLRGTEESNDAKDMNIKETETVSTMAMGLNAISTLLMLTVTTFISYKSVESGLNLFSWHPSLMCFGYLVLMFQAILSMSNANCWTTSLKYKDKVTLHWILQTAAITCVSLGFSCIFLNKMRMGKDHFQTNHAICGLATYILTCFIAFGGIWTKYSFQLRNYMKPVVAKLIHSTFGILIFCLAITTIFLAIYSDWFLKVASAEIRLPIVAILVIPTLWVIFKPLVLCWNRITTAFMRASI